MLLALKLLLGPSLVIAVSLAVRRWGAAVGGVLMGLPVIAGPILLVLDLAHGDRFAADAALATLTGLLSLSAFATVYGLLSATRGPVASLLGGWVAVSLVTIVLDRVALGAGIALATVLASFLLAAGTLRDRVPVNARGVLPRWDLALRALATVVMVLGVTTVAGAVGARLSGLLASIPVLASVLVLFTHRQLGAAAVRALLSGLLSGCIGFALFAFVVAAELRGLGAPAAFGLAAMAAVGAQAATLRRVASRLSGPSAPSR